MRLNKKDYLEFNGRAMPVEHRPGEREPLLFRLANAVDFVVGIPTVEIGFVVLGLFVALIVGGSLVGLLLEFVVGTSVLRVVAGMMSFLSDDL